MLSKPQRLLCWSRITLLLSPFSVAVNGGAAGRQKVRFAPCKLAEVSLCVHFACSHLWFRAGMYRGGRWPCTLLSHTHWHPKAPAKGSRLTYAPTDGHAVDTHSDVHRAHPELAHTDAPTDHSWIQKYTHTSRAAKATVHC